MNRLWVRLSLGFLLVVALGIGAMTLAISRATEASFRGYVGNRNAASAGHDLIDRLQDHYAATGSWDGADSLLPTGGQGRGQGGGTRFLLADESGRVVSATDADQLGRTLTQNERDTRAIPLVIEGNTAGYLLQDTPRAAVLDAAAQQFLDEIGRWLLVASLASVSLALLLGIGLAWQFTRPLGDLAVAADRMAQGDFEQGAHVKGTQEITDLARAFNHLSSELARAEALRQRMTTDIAHELRTPVSVIRGQLEAMLDGVVTADSKNIAIVYDQSLHLARLVDDLRILTQAEAGELPLNKALHDPAALVERAHASFEALAADVELVLHTEVEPGLPQVTVDSDRIQQVFANLLSNALRHTPSGGEICLKASLSGNSVSFLVSNTGPGLTPDQVNHVFERFWRAGAAREHDKGGAGLGLAIARSLVEAHGGRIWVESERGKGAQFFFYLPSPQNASQTGHQIYPVSRP